MFRCTVSRDRRVFVGLFLLPAFSIIVGCGRQAQFDAKHREDELAKGIDEAEGRYEILWDKMDAELGTDETDRILQNVASRSHYLFSLGKGRFVELRKKNWTFNDGSGRQPSDVLRFFSIGCPDPDALWPGFGGFDVQKVDAARPGTAILTVKQADNSSVNGTIYLRFVEGDRFTAGLFKLTDLGSTITVTGKR